MRLINRNFSVSTSLHLYIYIYVKQNRTIFIVSYLTYDRDRRDAMKLDLENSLLLYTYVKILNVNIYIIKVLSIFIS